AINVAGDVVETIVTRELEGASGAVDHLVSSSDPLYDGLAAEGFDYNVATATTGNVVITETSGFTAVREGGPVSVDSYMVRLAAAPTATVYVTVSAARSPQEEEDDLLDNPFPLTDGPGDTIWVSTSLDFERHIVVNGQAVDVPQRSVVLKFTAANWQVDQTVNLFAVDDTRSEGDRFVVVQHSVISDDARFDATDVRNVEVEVRDNDTPGVYVTEVQPGTSMEDGRTVVIEGDSTTQLTDQVLVQLATQPEDDVVVRLFLNESSDEAIRVLNVNGVSRMFQGADGYWRIRFDQSNWDSPVRVGIQARDDMTREDAATAIISFQRDAVLTEDDNYIFPNLRSGTGLLDIEVIDNETAGAVVIESGGSSQLILDDTSTPADEGRTDDYTIRLTKQPSAVVDAAILTDGLADVISVDGVSIAPHDYKEIGGLRAAQLFTGSIIFANDSGKGTLTRGTGADLGSFLDEGLSAGQLLRISGAGTPYDGDYVVENATEHAITLTTPFAVGIPVEILDTVALSDLTREGTFQGSVNYFNETDAGDIPGEQLVRVDNGSFLADGFLEGQWVRVIDLDNAANVVELKIQLIRGDNATQDNKVQFTSQTALPSWLTDPASDNVRIVRIAAVATFTSANWYDQQTVVLEADPHYFVPPTREGVKVFPVSTHLLSKLRGPLAVEGGVTGADRSLKNGLKLPGEADSFLIAIGAQPPESQQVDVLNVFNDSSQADGTGVMDDTTLRGFGMADDLDFAALYGLDAGDTGTFGESLVFPGGISYGKINFGSNGFGTSDNTSTIEVLNVMLGEGNDGLTITGTLNPAASVSATQEFVFTTNSGGGTISREGFDWKAQGFLVGQSVQIQGQPGVWTVTAINDVGNDPNDNSILVLSGVPLPVLTGERTIVALDALVLTTQTVNISQTATGGIVTRLSGSWSAEGFLEGHLVTMGTGDGARQYRIVSIDGLKIELEGESLADAALVTRTFWVQGPHGGLTVVHGGGNMPLTSVGDMNLTNNALTRLDGRDWSEDGYKVDQLIQLEGETYTRRIVEILDATIAPPSGAALTWGDGSRLVLSNPLKAGGAVLSNGDYLAATNNALTVHIATALRTEVTETIAVATSSITRSSGTWQSAGFYAGQKVWISGLAGPFIVSSLSGNVMNLQNVALTPQSGATFTVFGFDETLDGGVLMGGDHIIVTGGAGPNSPLVVYGDTSQDGVWYSGHPQDVLGMEFGEKPFDGFFELTDEEKEDDEWVFPLANPYTYAGNDVIDATALFAGISAQALPSVGFTAYGGEGDDFIYGSQAGDHLAGGSGNDVIHGNRGTDHIFGDSGFNVDILTRALLGSSVDRSPEPTVDNDLQTDGTTIDPYPSPVRDEMTAGRDLLYGEAPQGTFEGPESVFDDVILADHGLVLQNTADPNLPDPPALPGILQKIQTTTLDSILAIYSQGLQNGDDDVVFGNLGRDVLIGGAGNDMLDGDEADDLLLGDNVTSLTRQGGADGSTADDTESLRFQTLSGTLLYSRTDRGLAGVNADNSGQLLTDGTARKFRDPDGAPWWAEYTVDYAELHTFAFDEGLDGVGSFGNDYLAGGQNNDLIFGQLGHDVVQGDGGIDNAFAAASHVGASRTPGGLNDPLGPLTVIASVEAGSDGEDYIEGGGGNDVLFGGLGQDDLTGGSSSFFSLIDAETRPDGDDYIFGGAGTQIDRDSDATDDRPTDGSSEADKHARDADTIAADNANIVRIVGVNHVDKLTLSTPQLYEVFNYDNYGALKLIVRGVTLLDYTPGGPDFRPDLFSLLAAAPGMRPEFGIWAKNDIGGHDEIHSETGDDTVYGGGGQDRMFGDADDDDLIGGWGNDWISGGTGQDGVLGDDGRIFTSRNTAGDIAQYSEPLYGINFLLGADPDPQHPQIIHGNVIDEFIYTPGQVQTATINKNQALNKAVDITPYNLRPNLEGADDPLFDPIFADDMIFGGLGADFLHGASGDDAIGGGEARGESYTQRFDDVGAVNGLVRTDFNRPWNPGDILHFGADTDPWNAPKPLQSRLGEFLLYDEYDPRRIILFDASGAVWKSGSSATFDKQYFLNLTSNEGPEENGAVAFASNGTPTAFANRNTDGDDAIFGDLGNDWQVGGTGRDTIYSGWGNDLANADDVLDTAGGLNDIVDTHPLYADRVFGGAGLDVLIANTGTDRLIDWVGEFNSYIVPFSAFGIDTISRQVPPRLPEFLYALSASHGADPTRDTDTGNLVRNGEPDGELGLVIQQDHGLWQDQTGGPTDPQPGNIPGGRRDIKGSADFNDGSMDAFAVDSGIWQVANGALSVAAESLGKDAAAVFYADAYLPIYYELKADVTVQKPTGGWKANAYVLFDYFSPTDFKFAGIDVSLNKMVVGHRDATGWIIDAQAPFTGALDSDTRYQVLVAVNGTLVTVRVDDSQAFSFNYAPRILNGESVGLNKGFIGVGSDNARGLFDNVVVQALPPQMTLDIVEDFNDGQAQQFTGEQSGSWAVNQNRYVGTAGLGSIVFDTLDLGAPIGSTSVVEVQSILSTTGIGGIIFDQYSSTDFKFVALDVAAQKVLVGHVDPRRGWIVDSSSSRALTAGTDYALGLVMNGASVNVTLNGSLVLTYGYNSAVADGAVGVLSRGGAAASTTSFDSFRILTNDPAFETAAVFVSDATASEGNVGSNGVATVFLTLSHDVAVPTTVNWATANGTAIAGLDYVGASGSATFDPGTDRVAITITLLGDGLVEADEWFSVVLSAPVGMVIGRETGTATILNDDATPLVSVSAVDAAGAEQNRDPLSFVITRSANLAGDIVVNLSWTGTAALTSDYTLAATGGMLSANGLTLTMVAGTTSATISATPVDDTAQETSENVTLNLLTGAGYAVGNANATGSIADNDTPAVVTLGVTDSQGAEQGSDPIVFTIARTANTSSSITINLSWSGPAVFGADYTVAVNGGTLSGNGTQLTLSAGISSATITVTPTNDTAVELNEAVVLGLSSGTGYTVGTPSSQSGTIVDNDLPSVSIANAQITEGNNGTSTVVITVTLSAAKSTPVTVAYATANGTAVAPTDYQSSSGTVTFAPGVTSRTISISIVGDRTQEANETFQVNLSNPSGATIGTGTATVTILDDERAMLAETYGVASEPVSALTASQLDAVVAQAKSLWLTQDPTVDLSGMSFSIAELDGLYLGLMTENEVTIDATAAGHGWFIDSEPANTTLDVRRIDLLTVITHEFGHVLGYDHDDVLEFKVMDEDLEAGARYLLKSTLAGDVEVQDEQVLKTDPR
ncbi:MAG TPA: Calx-beta domain-containing protein, partial [Terriglobia bacterium]|nr:Calx-beta domain-containing protein [Terriglobia bacterium]